MRNAIMVAALIASQSVWAVDPYALPMAIQMQKLANASMCESYKGDKSALGRAMNKQCRDRAKAEFEEIQDEKPLRDCMKPGNVIDDDVRKCMKGL